ncbi:MAG: class I SAM-dependent rRNA methyltransferase [candidate division WOR-3 bacterium]|nr:MAG: class I SAM-dependent rRNA methyltransferase [candidate division WOR-3 bacterium]
MPEKKVLAARKRSRKHHPWVFSNEVIETEGQPETGDAVLVYDRGRFAGSGLYNANSLIQVRLYSALNQELDEVLLRKRLREAAELRATELPGETDFRLAFGESDRLPGLVVDRYGRHYVVQNYSAGMDQRREMVAGALVAEFDAECVYEKDDFRLREPEGLVRREGVLYGRPPERVIISENGVRFQVDIRSGQKTGWYFDQRNTRRRVRETVKGRRFLDVFCYTGGLAINAALGGAERVVAVDGSAAACAIASENAALNGVEELCEFSTADAFAFLKDLPRFDGEFDVICLDPPAFIKSRKEKRAGLRAFRTINALAMKALPRNGILVSCSCSHYLFWQDMVDMLTAAAQDAGRNFTIIERTTQGPDHPVLLGMPESEYLRCFFLRVV